MIERMKKRRGLKSIALVCLAFYVLSWPTNALAAFVCGQDLNGDGYLGEAGETADCTTALGS